MLRITGFAELKEKLSRLVGFKPDLTSQQQTLIIRALQSHYREVWNTKGGVIGADWKGNTLVRTGTLRNSMTNKLVPKFTRNRIEITSSAPYSEYVNNRYTFIKLNSKVAGRIARIILKPSGN